MLVAFSEFYFLFPASISRLFWQLEFPLKNPRNGTFVAFEPEAKQAMISGDISQGQNGIGLHLLSRWPRGTFQFSNSRLSTGQISELTTKEKMDSCSGKSLQKGTGRNSVLLGM